MNQNELVKEICKREQGVGKGLNVAQVKTVLRHLGGIESEVASEINGKDFDLKKDTNWYKRSPFTRVFVSAIKRNRKK